MFKKRSVGFLSGRFSIRALLIFTTVAGAFTYFCLLPTLNATSYINALQRDDFAAAAALCIQSTFPSPDASVNPGTISIDAKLERMNLKDLFSGRRAMTLSFTYDIEGSLPTLSQLTATYVAEAESNHQGIRITSVTP